MFVNQIHSCEISLSYFFDWLEKFMEAPLVDLFLQDVSPSEKSLLVGLISKKKTLVESFEFKAIGFTQLLFFRFLPLQLKDKIEVEIDLQFLVVASLDKTGNYLEIDENVSGVEHAMHFFEYLLVLDKGEDLLLKGLLHFFVMGHQFCQTFLCYHFIFY